MNKSKKQGWYGESRRHSLASKGIKSGHKQYSPLQKVPYKQKKKLLGIEISDDNKVEEKTVEQEDNKTDEKPEDIEEEKKTDEPEDKPEKKTDEKPKKKGILIDTYEKDDE